MITHELQVVNPNEASEEIDIDFSLAELKRIYNLVYEKNCTNEKEGYESLKMKNLMNKLKYHIDDI